MGPLIGIVGEYQDSKLRLVVIVFSDRKPVQIAPRVEALSWYSLATAEDPVAGSEPVIISVSRY